MGDGVTDRTFKAGEGLVSGRELGRRARQARMGFLNRSGAELRWLPNRDDSPWFPMLRQFRQSNLVTGTVTARSAQRGMSCSACWPAIAPVQLRRATRS